MIKISRILKTSESGYISNSIYTGIALSFFGSTRFGFNIILQLVYGSEFVGNYNLVFSSAMILSTFIASIFNIGLSKFTSEARGKKDKHEFQFFMGIIFKWLFISALSASLLYYLFAPYLSASFKIKLNIFKWGAPYILLYCIYHFFRQMYYVVEKIKFYMSLEIISSLLFFLSLFICIKNKSDDYLLLPMVIQMGFFVFISIITFFPYLKKIHWFGSTDVYLKKHKRHIKRLIQYSAITGIGTALTSISLHIFVVVLGTFADIKSVGQFSLIRSSVNPATYLYRIISTVNFPKIAYIYGTGDFFRLKQFIRKGIKKIISLATLIFIPIILLSPVISKFLFKEETTAGLIFLFASMTFTSYFRTVAIFHLNFLSATRYPLIPNIIGPISILIVIPFLPMVFKKYGSGGVGALIIIADIVWFLFIIVLGEKKLLEFEKK